MPQVMATIFGTSSKPGKPLDGSKDMQKANSMLPSSGCEGLCKYGLLYQCSQTFFFITQNLVRNSFLPNVGKTLPINLNVLL